MDMSTSTKRPTRDQSALGNGHGHGYAPPYDKGAGLEEKSSHLWTLPEGFSYPPFSSLDGSLSGANNDVMKMIKKKKKTEFPSLLHAVLSAPAKVFL